MGRGTIASIAVVAVTALLVTGCGGGSDKGSGDAASISKEQFIAKADAICKKGTERMQSKIISVLKKQRNLTKVSKSEQEELVGTVIVPSVKQEVKELRELPIPDGDEEKVDAMIVALEEGIETAESDPEAVANSSDVVFGIASRIGSEYGLEVCGSR